MDYAEGERERTSAERREGDKSEGKLMVRFTVAGGAGETAAKRVYSFGMIKATREGTCDDACTAAVGDT